jgi:hypothetical protein
MVRTLLDAVKSALSQPAGGGGRFLKLPEGESIEGAFTGRAAELFGVWRDRHFVPWEDKYYAEGLSPKTRFALEFVPLDEGRAQIVEVNPLTLREFNDELPNGLDYVRVRLRRVGAKGTPQSRIAVRYVRDLTLDEAETLEKVVPADMDTAYAEFFNADEVGDKKEDKE